MASASARTKLSQASVDSMNSGSRITPAIRQRPCLGLNPRRVQFLEQWHKEISIERTIEPAELVVRRLQCLASIFDDECKGTFKETGGVLRLVKDKRHRGFGREQPISILPRHSWRE